MTRFPSTACAVTAVFLAVRPAMADPTPALPFFSKPFPTGYAYREPPCIERRMIQTASGWRYRTVYLCGPVIHARD